MGRTRFFWSVGMALVALGAVPAALQGCGGDDDDASQAAPTAGGSSGAAGSSAGASGTAGAAGSQGGSAGSPGSSTKAVADLRGDTNRDGTVDLSGDADDKDEDTWDKTHGAIFMANIDDDQKKCSTKGTDYDLAKCNDAADDVINGPDDLDDLARLKTAPWADAPDDATGQITLDDRSADYVRLFKNDGSGTFTVFDPANDALTAAELRSGVEFAIEGKDIVRDEDEWDGYASVTLQINGGTGADGLPVDPASDVVKLRLAPVLTHHHLQPAEEVFVANIPEQDSIAMRTDLKAAATAAKLPKPVNELKASAVSYDQWTQDYFEPAYAAMPKAGGGLHVMRVIYRSANVYGTGNNPLRPAGRVAFTTLRGKDVGAVQQFDIKHSGAMDSLNSFGNTETIPPYTLGDKSYPLGRLLRGSVKSFYPDPTFARMLESQQVQPHVYIDTSWLLVGHVDETISFVKTKSPRGWALIINDARLAKKMIEDQVAKGNGDVHMFVGQKWEDDNGQQTDAEISLSDVLKDTDVIKESASSAVEVDNQLDILTKELGLTDDEIIRIPYLHQPTGSGSLAYQPGTVNGIYLSDTDFGAPSPHGPVIDGKDIFEAQMTEAFAKVGVTVRYIEDWDLYHRLAGEVHCGTNTYRTVSQDEKWWESGY